jgi:hypothetical protein
MSARYTSNTSVILSTTAHNASLGLRLLTDAIVKTAAPKTPKRKGNLRNDVLKQVLGLHASIRWDKRYAQVQETGVIKGSRIRKYTTPGTGPHFAENAVRTEVQRADDYFKQADLI